MKQTDLGCGEEISRSGQQAVATREEVAQKRTLRQLRPDAVDELIELLWWDGRRYGCRTRSRAAGDLCSDPALVTLAAVSVGRGCARDLSRTVIELSGAEANCSSSECEVVGAC